MTVKTKKPFRKQVKDFLNGLGGISAAIGGLFVVNALYGNPTPENGGMIMFASIAIAACAFGLASTIKPKRYIKGRTEVETGMKY